MAGDPSAGVRINPLKPYIILSFKSGELLLVCFCLFRSRQIIAGFVANCCNSFYDTKGLLVFDLFVKKYPLILQHDNRIFKGYERPCAGLEEVSLTSLTEHIK